MTQLPGFFTLPQEIRDQIYGYHFSVEGGYTLNIATRKLTKLHGGYIDLSLRFTSRQIALETRGLALRLNAVHVSSEYSEESCTRAGQFDVLSGIIDRLKARYLLRHALCSNCIDAEVRAYAAEHHPRFLPIIQNLLQHTEIVSIDTNWWRETPSQARHFVESTLDLIAARNNFPDIVTHGFHWVGHKEDPSPLKVIAQHQAPWNVPTEEDVAAMHEAVEPIPIEATWPFFRGGYWDEERYRFSAAAMAIAFLNSLPEEMRLELRELILNEDRVAVAWPECHAQGLIPFCQENPRLRIKRIVSLWKALLPRASLRSFSLAMRTPADIFRYGYDHVKSSEISKGHSGHGGVADWIMEASILTSLGMPADSFSLILDGEPTPNRSAQVFDIVQHDALWQTAYSRCVSGWSDPPTWQRARNNEAYIMEGFPEALEAMVEGRSIVSCNFDIGTTQDPDRLVSQGRTWTLEEWSNNWRETAPMNLQTEAPLPAWLDILREDIIPE
jgi:hypothetical protein